MMNEFKKQIKSILEDILENTLFIPVGVSNRHIHLDRKALDALYGQGYELTPQRPLSQIGQYASEEKVDVITEAGSIKGIRILGPLREATQLELSKTDARQLRINPPIRISGNLKNSTPIVLQGPKGQYRIDQGVIIAERHMHLSYEDSIKYGIENGDVLSVEVGGDRPMILGGVVVRVSKDFVTELHLDIDEANSANLSQGDYVKVLR